MSDRIGNLIARIQRPVAVAMIVLPAMAPLDLASAQATPQPAPPAQGATAQPAPEQSEPPPPDHSAPKENPGLINEIGKLLEKPGSLLPTLKSPKQTIDDAADALARLAKSPGVKGRAACPVAANGAPDCKAGADRLCQSKGFKEGKSLDVDTTRTCSAKALLSGRKPDESECRTETHVTRAVCQ
jgi:hypothetical protein